MIRYFVVKGIATATEVSVVGIIYTLLVGVLIYRGFKWRSLYPTLTADVVRAIESVLTSGPRTREIGGTAGTEEVGKAIAAAI